MAVEGERAGGERAALSSILQADRSAAAGAGGERAGPARGRGVAGGAVCGERGDDAGGVAGIGGGGGGGGADAVWDGGDGASGEGDVCGGGAVGRGDGGGGDACAEDGERFDAADAGGEREPGDERELPGAERDQRAGGGGGFGGGRDASGFDEPGVWGRAGEPDGHERARDPRDRDDPGQRVGVGDGGDQRQRVGEQRELSGDRLRGERGGDRAADGDAAAGAGGRADLRRVCAGDAGGEQRGDCEPQLGL